MRLELKNIERAESYLNDELNAQDRREFENELVTNTDLADTLIEVRLLRKAIVRNELRKQIKDIRPKGGFNTPFVIGLISVAVILTVWSLWSAPTPEVSNAGDRSETSKEAGKSLVDDSALEERIDEEGAQKSKFGGKKFYVTPDIQKFSFKSEEGATVMGKDGMLIIVPKNAFIDEAGKELNGDVKLILVEALGISEMVLYNLHTVSNGSVLESGGMFYTETTINGEVAKINPKRPFYIEIPTPEKDTDMMLFQSEVKPDGTINWIAPKPLEQFLVMVPLSELDFLPEGFASEVSANMPFLNYETLSNTLTDSLYYSLKWRQHEIPIGEELIESNTISEVLNYCGIAPISIETIKTASFQNSFIATKAFEERVREMHRAQNGDALLRVYIQNIDKDLHVCDALVADAVEGELKIVFKEFSEENLKNIKDAALYSEQLQAYYKKRRKELRDIHNRVSTAYKETYDTKTGSLNYKDSNASTVRSSSVNPSTVRQSSSNVFAGRWASNGWGNIDKYMVRALISNTKEVVFKIENESENADVGLWLGEINTYTGLNKNDGKYLARFPKQGKEKTTVSHIFAIEQTSDGYNWGYKNFDSRLEEEAQIVMASANIEEIRATLDGVEMNFGRLKNRLDQIVIERVRREKLQREWEQKREAQLVEKKKLMAAYNAELARLKEIAGVTYKLRVVAFPCDQKAALEEQMPDKAETTLSGATGESTIFLVKQMPTFPGGEKELYKFLSKNTVYPKLAKENGVSGLVWITMVVDSDGTIRDPEVIKSLSPECDAEALRVIRMMPAWIPGRQRGTAVPVQYNIPIKFTLR